MANSKNSTRRKRKYDDRRKSATERNHKARQKRHELWQARMVARTQSLIGKHVSVRVKDQAKPFVGTVIEVLRKGDEGYPSDAKRNVGAYLVVRTTIGDLKASRHRAKVID